MADRHLILRRGNSVALPKRMVQDIASVINRLLFHQEALANIRILKVRRNPNGAINAITHQNATPEISMQCRDMIIWAARTVDRGVLDVEVTTPWQRLKIHAVPLVWYMEKTIEGLSKIREEFEEENEGIPIPTQVQ
jgi:hypothetical protein